MVLSSSALTHQSMGLSPSAATTRSRSQFHHHTHNSGTVLTRAMHSMHADGDRNDVDSSRRQALLALSSSMLVLPGLVGNGLAEEPVKSAYDFELQYRGDPFPLSQYKNKVTFGGQAPGTSEEERQDALRKFGTSDITVVDKVLVNGPDAHPLYKYLKAEQPVSLPNAAGKTAAAMLSKDQGAIEWNYTKFLCNSAGIPVKRFKSGYDPAEFEGDLRLLLAGKDPLPAECAMHPGRIVCKVDRLLEG
ncbi:Glutathione peroxidase-like protein [Picochlorum sp. SENEW3]|nr:Glutathione peroxidase-like protein [Picochlorum sp. SENEW3]WPT14877.1 Glutathione peroxidase-like protein [Picochlorum sp. SENEW3]